MAPTILLRSDPSGRGIPFLVVGSPGGPEIISSVLEVILDVVDFDIELQADDLRHTRDTVLGLIARDTGHPVDRIFTDSLHDRWYSAAEALDYGMIDEILTRTKKER